MCIRSHSESGQPCGFEPCVEYIQLLSEKSRLEGRCKGLEEGNARNQEAMKRQDEQLVSLLAENESLRQEASGLDAINRNCSREIEKLRQGNQLLRAENANLSMAHGPDNHTDWMLTRASKYEQLHKDLETLRQDRDRLVEIVHTCMATMGMTQTAWEGTNIPRSENDLSRWVYDVSQASYEKGLALEKADALADAASTICQNEGEYGARSLIESLESYREARHG